METIAPAIAAEIDRADEAPFCIDTCDRADWLLRKLANLASEKARVKAQAATIVAQLESDAAALQHLFGAQLETFVAAEIERRGGKRKSIAFLQGTCAYRTVPGGLVIADAAAAREAAREIAPDLLSERTVEEFDTAAFLKRAEYLRDGTGELLPGIETVPDRESFSIKFGKE